MKIEKTVLKNGATILGINLPEYNSVTISFGFKTGSRTEPAELAGMSHFLEHMLFKGSAKRPNSNAFAQEADAIGAQHNAFTGKEFTGYYIKTESNQFETALDIIGDMITNPLLSQEELEKERGTIIEEINMYRDNPTMHLVDLMDETLYGNNAMGRNIAGDEKTVANIQADTMRGYYQEHYNPQNMAVAVVGNIPKDYVEQIAEYVNRMPVGKPTVWEYQSFDTKKVGFQNRDISQTNLGVMIPTVPIDSPERYPLQVLAAIIGGYMSARLFTEIRLKRGWAYRIWAFSENAFDSGYFGIYGGVKKDKTEASIKLIKKILTQAYTNITEEEVKRAIGNVVGSALITQETSDTIAKETLVSYLLTGKVSTPLEEANQVAKVTLKEVRAVAKKYLKAEEIRIAIIGPFKDEAKFAKILAES